MPASVARPASVVPARVATALPTNDVPIESTKKRPADGSAMAADQSKEDRGQAFMKEVKRLFQSEGAYKRFKEAFREALVLIKQCSKAHNMTEGVEALHQVKWLLSDPRLARSLTLAQDLAPLLPPEFMDAWLGIIAPGEGRSATEDIGGMSDRPSKMPKQLS
jgi:hypothetical protein